MIDPHRRCGSTGHAASISTFEGSNSSSSCGSRLGNREVEHGETDGVDEWHVGGDDGGPTRAGSAGGNPPAGSGRRARGPILDLMAEPQPESGLRGNPGPAGSSAGVHPARSSRPPGFGGSRSPGAADPRLGMVPVANRGLFFGRLEPAAKLIVQSYEQVLARENGGRDPRIARRTQGL